MSAIYAATLTAADPLRIFKAGAEADKLFLVNAYLSASSLRVAYSGSFEQEITNCPAVWFDFLIEPGTELWVQGRGDFKFTTMVSTIIDSRDRSLVYAYAGHPSILRGTRGRFAPVRPSLLFYYLKYTPCSSGDCQ